MCRPRAHSRQCQPRKRIRNRDARRLLCTRSNSSLRHTDMNPASIFVSSVQKEFAQERRAIRDFVEGDALLRRFFDVFLFEDLPASDRRAAPARRTPLPDPLHRGRRHRNLGHGKALRRGGAARGRSSENLPASLSRSVAAKADRRLNGRRASGAGVTARVTDPVTGHPFQVRAVPDVDVPAALRRLGRRHDARPDAHGTPDQHPQPLRRFHLRQTGPIPVPVTVTKPRSGYGQGLIRHDQRDVRRSCCRSGTPDRKGDLLGRPRSRRAGRSRPRPGATGHGSGT